MSPQRRALTIMTYRYRLQGLVAYVFSILFIKCNKKNVDSLVWQGGMGSISNGYSFK